MSGTRIIAQATPALLVSFPNWKQPTLCGVRASIGGAGVATVISTESDQGDAPTTPHWTIARTATAGIYDVTFPAVRRWAPGTLLVTLKSASAAGDTYAAGDQRFVAIDRSTTNTNPRGVLLNGTLATGRIRLGFLTGGAATELSNGSEVNLSLWVDYGS
jgi:hypothetical protein